MHEISARAYIHRNRRTASSSTTWKAPSHRESHLFIYNLKLQDIEEIAYQHSPYYLQNSIRWTINCNFLKWVNPGSVSTFEIAYLDFFLWIYSDVCEMIYRKYNTQHNCLPEKKGRTTPILGADIFLNESIQGVSRQSPSVVALDSCRAIHPNSSPRIKWH